MRKFFSEMIILRTKELISSTFYTINHNEQRIPDERIAGVVEKCPLPRYMQHDTLHYQISLNKPLYSFIHTLRIQTKLNNAILINRYHVRIIDLQKRVLDFPTKIVITEQLHLKNLKLS